MKRKEIHFVIDRDGNIQSTVRGIKGSGCSAIAVEIEKLGRIVMLARTKEFYAKCDGQTNLLNLNRNEQDPSKDYKI